MRIFVLLTLVAPLASARTTLYAPSPTPAPNVTDARPISKKASSSGVSLTDFGTARSWSMVARGNPISVRPGQVSETMSGVRLGDIVNATINQSVIAFADSKAPVTGTITLSKGIRLTLVGEAILEKNSKRILVHFSRIRNFNSDIVYALQADVLDSGGTLGLEGDYHSGESKLFAAEFLSAAAAGFADSSINRSTNAFGQTQDDNSIDTKSKKALSAAMTRTADQFAEQVRKAPEYSTLEGPLTVKVLILEQPIRKL